MNQTCHTRPILLSYDQAIGNTNLSQSNLRLPEYKENYLSRFTPYARYTAHRRFFINDEVPSYDEATTSGTILPPTRRAALEPAPAPAPVEPGRAEAIKTAIKEFFELLAQRTLYDDDETKIELALVF